MVGRKCHCEDILPEINLSALGRIAPRGTNACQAEVGDLDVHLRLPRLRGRVAREHRIRRDQRPGKG